MQALKPIKANPDKSGDVPTIRLGEYRDSDLKELRSKTTDLRLERSEILRPPQGGSKDLYSPDMVAGQPKTKELRFFYRFYYIAANSFADAR